MSGAYADPDTRVVVPIIINDNTNTSFIDNNHINMNTDVID